LHEKRNNFKETGKIIKAKIRKLIWFRKDKIISRLLSYVMWCYVVRYDFKELFVQMYFTLNMKVERYSETDDKYLTANMESYKTSNFTVYTSFTISTCLNIP
jgi:hypothetical protein